MRPPQPAGPATPSIAPSRPPQDVQPSPRLGTAPAPPPADLPRIEPLPAQHLRPRMDVHGAPPYQALPPLQQQQVYLQSQPQGTASQQPVMTSSHSRHPSLSAAPGSPAQAISKHTPEASPIRRSSFGHGQPQSSYYPYSGPPAPSMSQQPTPVLSPSKEPPRQSSTPAPPPEPPRQVPAKRSNIMNILNDEPEEPQPRKRFAGDQVAASPRGGYAGTPSLPQSAPSEPPVSAASQKPYLPPSQHQPPHLQPSQQAPSQGPSSQPRTSYSEYQTYSPAVGSSSSTGPPNHEWMARFDPRGQQQQQQQQQQQADQAGLRSTAPSSTFTSYAPPPPQSAASSQPPTPSPAPPPHRPSYQPGFPQAPTPQPPHSQGAPTPPPTNPAYRQAAASPTTRPSVLPYSFRQGPPTPSQSPASSLNIPPPRQPSGPGSSFSPSLQHPSAPSHPMGPQHRHSHSGHQSYQQHVQAMVRGSHQQQQPPPPSQHTQRPSIGLGPGSVPFGHSTPPPSQQGGSRPSGLGGGPPPPLSMGRPYTPPAPTLGGIPYPAGGHQNSYARPSQGADSGGPPHGAPGHHRVYSQGSNQGPPR